MRVLLFAALCTVVAGNQFQSMVSNLKSTIADVEFGSNSRSDGIAAGRKLILDNMIAGIESMESLTPDAVNFLTTAIPICQQILDTLMASRDASQGNLESLHDDFATCTPNFPDNAGNADLSTYQTTRDALSSAASAGWTAYEAYIDACTAVYDLISQHESAYSSLVCAPGAATQDNANAWLALFTTVQNAVVTQGRSTAYTTTRDNENCGGNQGLWHTARDAVNAQPTFNAYCNYVVTVHNNCVNRQDCHNAKEIAFNAAVAVAAGQDTQRETDAKMVTQIKCMIQALADGALNQAAIDTACAGVASQDFSAYSTNPESVPNMDACSVAVDVPSADFSASFACGADSAFIYDGHVAAFDGVHALSSPAPCHAC